MGFLAKICAPDVMWQNPCAKQSKSLEGMSKICKIYAKSLKIPVVGPSRHTQNLTSKRYHVKMSKSQNHSLTRLWTTVLRTPADRTDQFWPESVSKSEFLIVLRHQKWKFPRPLRQSLVQIVTPWTEILKNPCKSPLNRKSVCWTTQDTFTHFLGLWLF